jgi:hypothetical protein
MLREHGHIRNDGICNNFVNINISYIYIYIYIVFDRLCGIVVRVLGYGGPGSIPGTTRKK